MTVETAKAVADGVGQLGHDIVVIWHGGEPLAVGPARFAGLAEPFEQLRQNGRITHAVQTNGTLITEEWCRVFKRFDVRVGVSFDGLGELSDARRDWAGKPSVGRVLRGIERLRANRLQFSLLAVITEQQLGKAAAVYEQCLQLGAASIGFNIAEMENAHRTVLLDDDRVRLFWKELFVAWRARPEVRIREFSYALSWMRDAATHGAQNVPAGFIDLIPTVMWNGQVTILSPEFAGDRSERYRDFVVGSLERNSFAEIVQLAPRSELYIDHMAGVNRCAAECGYFSFCGGGQACNKWAEYRDLSVTETAYCRNAKMRLIDGLFDELQTTREGT